METLENRRRSAGSSPGGEAADALDGETALSQNTAEAEARGAVVASPFHSERVRDEVDLLNARPVSLDRDAAVVVGRGEEAAIPPDLGEAAAAQQDLEPPYATVARVSVEEGAGSGHQQESPSDGFKPNLGATVRSFSGGAQPVNSEVDPRVTAANEPDEPELLLDVPAGFQQEDQTARMAGLVELLIAQTRMLQQKLDGRDPGSSGRSLQTAVEDFVQADPSPYSFRPAVPSSPLVDLSSPVSGGMALPSGAEGELGRWEDRAVQGSAITAGLGSGRVFIPGLGWMVPESRAVPPLSEARAGGQPSSMAPNPSARQCEVLANPCAQQNGALPSPCTQQSVALPSPCAQQNGALPSPCTQQSVALPSPCVQQNGALPSPCTQQSVALPSPCTQQSVAFPSPCTQQNILTHYTSAQPNFAIQDVRPSACPPSSQVPAPSQHSLTGVGPRPGAPSGLGVESSGFTTPRSQAAGNLRYPVSPGGTVIRPPPGPPPGTPPFPNVSVAPHPERPEEPAKYISELPKLGQPDLKTSAVMAGNWLAQVRQVLLGLSPTAPEWWGAVEAAATNQYHCWLMSEPIDRPRVGPRGH